MEFASTFHYYWTKQADQRAQEWILMPNIWPMFVIISAYLYFVLVWGPRFMKHRPPYDLRSFVRVYNILQIIVNAWVVKGLIDAGWFTTITLYCEPVDYSDNPAAVKLLESTWWMIFVKMLDLVETCVFVLRKKDRQISGLHLYHHVSTLVLYWLAARYVAGGMATFITLANNCVHVIMYTYYFLSTLGPTVQKFVRPVKPLVTIVQMVQFCGMLIHLTQGFLPSCPVPRLAVSIAFTNVLINFALFYNFYKKTYVKAKKEKAK